MLLLVSLGFSQQQAQPPPAFPPDVTPPTFPEEPQMPPDQKAPPSATEVGQEIQDHVNAEPALANSNIGIKADESSVILTGTVKSDMQHALALRIAQSYVHGRKIVDKIRVWQQT